MQDIGHFINGQRVAGKSGRTTDVFNPATGEVQAKVALANADELNAAIENAKAAQPAWAAQSPRADEVRLSSEPRYGQAARSAVAGTRQDHS